MSNFFIILFCLIVGYCFRRFNLAGKNDYRIVNNWVIYVGLPSIALLHIPTIEWSITYLFTGLLPIVLFGLSYLFFKTINIWLKYSRRTVVTLTIVSGLSNTSFVGFPLIITFFGVEQLKVAIVSDQITFLTLSTLGVLLAASTKSVFLTKREKTNFIIKRLFTFPPFLACIAALFLGDLLVAKDMGAFFNALAATVSPMALFSIGMQLRFKNLDKEVRAISLSLFFKLLLGPLTLLLITYFLDFQGIFYQVSIFEMFMPCLVASSIIIEKFSLNIKLSNTIIGLSIVIGLLLSFFWYSVINTLL